MMHFLLFAGLLDFVSILQFLLSALSTQKLVLYTSNISSLSLSQKNYWTLKTLSTIFTITSLLLVRFCLNNLENVQKNEYFQDKNSIFFSKTVKKRAAGP